jgi:hypothetical protein
VQEKPSDDGSAEAVGADTRILDGTGRPVEQVVLSVGIRVTIWFSGPIGQSYPVQATASVLIIDVR